MPYLLPVGIALFALSVFFTIITLPVEFDASKRALVAINEAGILTSSEMPEAKRVLNAAALTYVAAAVTAVLEMIRLILIYRNR
jgi:Zn-dependent membrane protease YugP